ncbi:hypothetical protein PROFUN_07164 [Planoprotostelium fungivorum]|uniref:Uncharacterized protein n=1 Tax=Planoprotostelium fungivorum TaxID=1890364 RepID=A0A2P6NMB5_9EUKA|nr:hypothetical protein PROFUN_07164 [Planoprotostelium fungivorum]
MRRGVRTTCELSESKETSREEKAREREWMLPPSASVAGAASREQQLKRTSSQHNNILTNETLVYIREGKTRDNKIGSTLVAKHTQFISNAELYDRFVEAFKHRPENVGSPKCCLAPTFNGAALQIICTPASKILGAARQPWAK